MTTVPVLADGRSVTDVVVERPLAVVWRSVVPVVVCATYLWVLFFLALWVVGPMAGLGWQPILIGANSMQPAFQAGDVVLVTTDTSEPFGEGTVITYADPVWEGQLVTHRVVEVFADGNYQTKGDASAVADSTPIAHDTVLGAGRLLVPLIGLPMLWLATAPPLAAVWALLTVTAWVMAARFGQLTAERSVPERSPADRRQRGPLGRLLGRLVRPRPVAGLLRRWAPTTVAVLAAVPLVASVGPGALVWPLVVLLVDPRGPQVRVGRWHRRWTTGRVTHRLKPLPVGGTVMTVMLVVVTLVSTATFTAASANPTNNFGAATLAPATGLTATQSCAGATPTVTLNWTASTSPQVQGYTITRNAAPLATVTPGTAASHVDATTANNTAYTWTVTAYASTFTATAATASLTTSCVAPTPVHVASTSFQAMDTSTTITVPATAQTGDLLITFIGKGNNTVAAPAGWNLLRADEETVEDVYTKVFWRIATATDPGTGYTWTSVGGPYSGASVMLVYRGVDQTTPFDAHGGFAYGFAAAMIAPSITTTVANTRLLALYFHEEGSDLSNTVTPPGGMTEVFEGQSLSRTIEVAEEAFPTAGATGTRTATASAPDDGIGVLLALRPPGGAFAAAGYSSIAGASNIAGANGRLDPDSLATVGRGHRLQPVAAAGFEPMRQAMLAAIGVDLAGRISDSYRTYDQQVDVAARKGLYSQGGLAAQPGTSRHGMGMALDLDVGGPVGGWLVANAAAFGYHTIPREPWHWEYRSMA